MTLANLRLQPTAAVAILSRRGLRAVRSAFRNPLGPRREPGMRVFAHFGLQPQTQSRGLIAWKEEGRYSSVWALECKRPCERQSPTHAGWSANRTSISSTTQTAFQYSSSSRCSFGV